MRRCRRMQSLLLLGALVVGGVLAPLLHLGYMVASDRYAPFFAHAGGHHETNAHQFAAGAHFQSEHDGHAACPYLELFATPLVGNAEYSVSAAVAEAAVATRQEYAEQFSGAAPCFPRTARGPPAATSAVV